MIKIPTVSCLMPVYNAERYLEEAVESILSQTMVDWELILVDDGSQDSSGEILSRLSLREPRIKILSQSNTGIVGALNAGLSLCRGEYVARMDADDISFPSRFERQSAYLAAHQECVLVGGIALSSKPGCKREGADSGGGRFTTDLTRFPPRLAVSVHPLIMVRRSALVCIGGYSAKFPHAEDHDLYIRISKFGRIVNPPIDILFYRRHSNQVSIKHLEVQERSAAHAEARGVAETRGKEVAKATLDTYVYLRVWRRYVTVDPETALTMVPAVIWKMLTPSGSNVWTKDYLRLRFMCLAMLVWKIRILLSKKPIEA